MQTVRARISVEPYDYPNQVRECLAVVDEGDCVIRHLARYASWEQFKEENSMSDEVRALAESRLSTGSNFELEGVMVKQIYISEPEEYQ